MSEPAFVSSVVPLVTPNSIKDIQKVLSCPAIAPVQIAYEVHGHGPMKVLLVPGMCVCRRMWDAQVMEFAAFPTLYSICLLDNRGAGSSDILPAGLFDPQNSNYSLETLATDAWTVADHVFGSHSKVHVVGHSMGGMIAQR